MQSNRRGNRTAYCAAALLLAVAAVAAGGQSVPAKNKAAAPAGQSEQNWWKNAVIYEIYPRSFQDSNGDGIGDLNGITQRLDYLQELGVDAIWLTPVYPSPQVDFGYDISDYRAIDPQYGTMADFNRLVEEAAKRHIRVIMDMVMNHTSDQHKWFLESRSSRTNPYRDWYVWRDGKGETATSPGEPPNNWQSYFGHSAWQWDPKTRQYYYHKFYIQQPDLNWHNPKVHQAFKDIVAFWLERGVGGFRFDAITTLYEDPQLRDEGVVKDKNGNPVINAYGDPQLDDSRTNNQPGVHAVIAEMRAEADKFNSNRFPGTRVLIGETYLPNVAELARMYGTPQEPEFQLPMDTQVGFINKLDVTEFRSKLTDAETRIDGHIPLLLFDNHDNPRIDARYGDGVHNKEIERVIATVLFASRGAALFYYGDEIGMVTTPPKRKQDVKDPIGITGWPKEKGRDGERTPMQWNESAHAGFTPGKPWLPVPPSAATINVEAEKNNPESLFNWYRSLIELKKTVPAFAHGSNIMLDTGNTKVLSWLRQAPGMPQVVVSANFTAEPQIVNLEAGGAGLKPGHLKTLLKSPGGADPASLDQIVLGPFGVYIGEIE
ncbi:MAG TPA: alpha-glucosidase [Terracidiphilus sp.]|jgi:alpha-glucosidase|nr:alpha-glucosidase [Terracidiphilus sp.]